MVMQLFVFIGHFSYQFGLIDCTVNVFDQLYSLQIATSTHPQFIARSRNDKTKQIT